MESYDTILKRMKSNFLVKCGFPADNASDIALRMEVLAGEIFSAGSYLEWIRNQMFPQTAQGKYLDYHAQLRGLTRKSPIKSTVLLYFYVANAVGATLAIPKGTICSTSGDKGVRFITTEDSYIAAGMKAIYVRAEAMEYGNRGNVATGTVTVLVTLPLTDLKVTNTTLVTVGVDEESDDSLRRRVLSSMSDISNGTNGAFYKSIASSYSGVNSAGVIPRNRGNGTVDVFLGGKGTAVSSSVVETVQSGINSLREMNVDVLVQPATLLTYNVYVAVKLKTGFDIDDVSDNILARLKEYFATLFVGESVYLSNLGEIIFHVDGVENYTFNSLYTKDMKIANSQLAVVDKIIVTEAGDWS